MNLARRKLSILATAAFFLANTVLAETLSISKTQSSNRTVTRCKVDNVLRWKSTTVAQSTTLELYTADGKLKRTIKSAAELTDAEKEEYPDTEQAFSGTGQMPGFGATNAGKDGTDKLAVLKQYDPNGFAIVSALNDKTTFNFFSSNDSDIVSALDTGVHESLHGLDNQLAALQGGRHAFRLKNGTVIYVSRDGTFNRDKIFATLPDSEKSDPYVTTYLTGSSGHQGLHMLLDELNAYTQGGLTALRLSEGLKQEGHLNPGLQSMMYFLEKYLKLARQSDPNVYRLITGRADYKTALIELWKQAEEVLGQSCSSKYLSVDPDVTQRVYSDENRAEIESLLGRQIQLPAACEPKPEDSVNQAQQAAPVQTPKKDGPDGDPAVSQNNSKDLEDVTKDLGDDEASKESERKAESGK